MDAWSWLKRRVERDARATVPDTPLIGRAEVGSWAEAFHDNHQDEQGRIVADAFAPGD